MDARSPGWRNLAQIIALEMEAALRARIPPVLGEIRVVRTLPRPQQRPNNERYRAQDRIELASGAGRPEKGEEQCDGDPEQQIRGENARRSQRARNPNRLEGALAVGADLRFRHSHVLRLW